MEFEFGGNESLQTYSKEPYRLEKFMQIQREDEDICLWKPLNFNQTFYMPILMPMRHKRRI